MVKVYPNEINLFQLAAIGRTPGIRTGTTPFGMPPGAQVRYIGRSVPWKGLKGDAFWSWADANKPRLAEGLRAAIKISKGAAGTYGVALVALADGRQMVLPRKVVEQMRAAGKPVTVIREYEASAPAKDMRKRYGIRGEYKSIVGAYMGGAVVAAPVVG